MDRFKQIRKLCGYVENGSSAVVNLHQDDATREWIVRVDSRWWHGTSLEAALDAAAADLLTDEE